jgi:hypothetical protein
LWTTCAGKVHAMTKTEVHELVGMLALKYEDFPLFDEPLWVQSFAMADADAAFEAARVWCKYHAVWPSIAELSEIIHRMTEGMRAGKEKLWKAYLDECRRQGREPTFQWLIPEVA